MITLPYTKKTIREMDRGGVVWLDVRTDKRYTHQDHDVAGKQLGNKAYICALADGNHPPAGELDGVHGVYFFPKRSHVLTFATDKEYDKIFQE